jgi:hypothetical protein
VAAKPVPPSNVKVCSKVGPNFERKLTFTNTAVVRR